MHVSIIVTHNPHIQKLCSLCANLLSQGSYLVIVDNSEKSINREDLISSDSIKLISLKKNMGIAHAQNIGISCANDIKAKYVSFFDQDSSVNKLFISELISEIDKKKYHIVAPRAMDNDSKEYLDALKINKFGIPSKVCLNKDNEIKADIVISSGTTLLLSVIEKVGLFDEGLFIDHVDTEWCLRCRKNGFDIHVISSVQMLHSIGSARSKLGPLTIQIHNSDRCYYQIRNSFLLLRKDSIPKLFAINEIIKTLINRFLLLLLIKNKTRYLKSYFFAIIDGVFNKDGPKIR